MTRIAHAARAAWTKAQVGAVFALCMGAAMVLPLTLASVGFPTA
ncbi:MAG TPA: hypothetical protein PLS69_01660 [Terricaulis sp.]|nr:hypothetical protein [Terricaulis sp.]HRP09586.1 hypothetical protein [Terricaulis sp.]